MVILFVKVINRIFFDLRYWFYFFVSGSVLRKYVLGLLVVVYCRSFDVF